MSLKFSLNQPVAVVIGSGAGGGVLANELAQGGIDVVCLEAGKRLTMQDVVNDEAAMFPKFTWLDQRESSGQTIPGFPAWTCKTVGVRPCTGRPHVHACRAMNLKLDQLTVRYLIPH